MTEKTRMNVGDGFMRTPAVTTSTPPHIETNGFMATPQTAPVTAPVSAPTASATPAAPRAPTAGKK